MVAGRAGALKRSLAAEEAKAPEQLTGKTKKPKKRVAGQREMLLPIAGKGNSKDKAKEPTRPAARQRKAG